jgi:hypothetical protein
MGTCSETVFFGSSWLSVSQAFLNGMIILEFILSEFYEQLIFPSIFPAKFMPQLIGTKIRHTTVAKKECSGCRLHSSPPPSKCSEVTNISF